MNLEEVLNFRRSVRRYDKNKPIDPEKVKRLSCNSWGITLCNFPFMHTPLLIYTGRTSYLPLHEMKP